jgi:hypothetical protein
VKASNRHHHAEGIPSTQCIIHARVFRVLSVQFSCVRSPCALHCDLCIVVSLAERRQGSEEGEGEGRWR